MLGPFRQGWRAVATPDLVAAAAELQQADGDDEFCKNRGTPTPNAMPIATSDAPAPIFPGNHVDYSIVSRPHPPEVVAAVCEVNDSDEDLEDEVRVHGVELLFQQPPAGVVAMLSRVKHELSIVIVGVGDVSHCRPIAVRFGRRQSSSYPKLPLPRHAPVEWMHHKTDVWWHLQLMLYTASLKARGHGQGFISDTDPIAVAFMEARCNERAKYSNEDRYGATRTDERRQSAPPAILQKARHRPVQDVSGQPTAGAVLSEHMRSRRACFFEGCRVPSSEDVDRTGGAPREVEETAPEVCEGSDGPEGVGMTTLTSHTLPTAAIAQPSPQPSMTISVLSNSWGSRSPSGSSVMLSSISPSSASRSTPGAASGSVSRSPSPPLARPVSARKRKAPVRVANQPVAAGEYFRSLRRKVAEDAEDAPPVLYAMDHRIHATQTLPSPASERQGANTGLIEPITALTASEAAATVAMPPTISAPATTTVQALPPVAASPQASDEIRALLLRHKMNAWFAQAFASRRINSLEALLNLPEDLLYVLCIDCGMRRGHMRKLWRICIDERIAKVLHLHE